MGRRASPCSMEDGLFVDDLAAKYYGAFFIAEFIWC